MTYGTTTYQERSVFLFFSSIPRGLPPVSEALPAGFGALSAGSEALPIGSEALPINKNFPLVVPQVINPYGATAPYYKTNWIANIHKTNKVAWGTADHVMLLRLFNIRRWIFAQTNIRTWWLQYSYE